MSAPKIEHFTDKAAYYEFQDKNQHKYVDAGISVKDGLVRFV